MLEWWPTTLTCDGDPKIVFREESKHLDPNHDDAFVVFVKMINAQGKRVMINICSLTDILYLMYFKN